MAEDIEVNGRAGKKGFTPLLAGGLLALAITVFGLISMWTLALPITGVVAFLGYFATFYMRVLFFI